MTTEAISGPHTVSATDEKPRARRRARSSASAGSSTAGMLWFAGWLFTISFAKLVWWKALLGLIIWPFFLGQTLR
jgi:hypothetical protein